MSGGIYTTDNTTYLSELNDVYLPLLPEQGSALVYGEGGYWVAGTPQGGTGTTTTPDIFTISGYTAESRLNGTYKRVTYGCQGSWTFDDGNSATTYSNRWIQSGAQLNGGSDPDPGAMGIYEKNDDGQYTSILFVYNGQTRVGWCWQFGTQPFVDRHTVQGDTLGSVVSSPLSTTFDSDGFTFQGPGIPISAGALQYSGGATGVQVLGDLMDVDTADSEGPGGESTVLTYNATDSEWHPSTLLLNQYKLKDLGDVAVDPSVNGILKDVGTGGVSDFQSVALTLSLNDDVSNATPTTGEVLRFGSTTWEPGALQLDDLSDVATIGLPEQGDDGEFMVLTYNIVQGGTNFWGPRPLLLDQYPLSELGDVTVSTPQTNQVLKYDNSGWVNGSIELDNLSNVNASSATTGNVLKFGSTAWESGTLALNDLSNVSGTPNDDDILQWDSTQSRWTPVSGQSVGGGIGNLNDVTIDGPQAGEILQYTTGLVWENQTLRLGSASDVNVSSGLVGPNDETTVLTYNSLGQSWVPHVLKMGEYDLGSLKNVSVDPGANGVLKDVGTSSNPQFTTVPLTLSLNDDVSISELTTGDLLQYDGNNWTNYTLTLNGVSDVNASSPTTDALLTWNGSAWVADTSLQTQVDDLTLVVGTNADNIETNTDNIGTLTTQVEAFAAAIENIDVSVTTATYTPPSSSRFELQLEDGVPSQGWVAFRNRLYDYSKLKSFQFTANTAFPWGAAGPTNGIEQSLNQSLFNGCAELRHAPQYYWAYEASGVGGTLRTFWLMQGQFDLNQFTYGWSFDVSSGSGFLTDRWTMTDSSSGGALVNSLHRRGQFTCHTLSNTGRSTLNNSSDGVAYQEFPLAFSLTNHPYTMTDYTTTPIFQDNTWVDTWGLYATYSTDGLYLYTSRDGVMWDRMATGLDVINVTSISIYPFGRGLGFAMQTSDNRYMFGVQPDPRLPAQGYYSTGVCESFCSSGKVVMWWDTGSTRILYSRDGLTIEGDVTTTDRIGGPWVRTDPDPRCDTPTTGAFFYSTTTSLRYSTDNSPTNWININTAAFDSRQLMTSLVGQQTKSTFIGGTPTSTYLLRSVQDSGNADVRTASTGVINYVGDSAILGEIGTKIETRTYAPIWAARLYFNTPRLVSFDRGVTWETFGTGLSLPYAFAHSDEMFVCVGYPSNNKGVIFYSTDAVNWYEAVNDPTIPIPGPGLPGITEDTMSNYRFSDVYYETEHRRFVAISQNRVGLSGDGITWTFTDMPDDPNNPGNRPIFQASFNGWNEYLRYGDAYYTRSGFFAGDYSRILALRISASGSLTFTDTGLFSQRERSRSDTIAQDPDNGQFKHPQWWATSLGIVAVEWKGSGTWRVHTFSFPRDSTTLTKSTTIANLGDTVVFYNMTTGYGGLIGAGLNLTTGESNTVYVSPDGLTWSTNRGGGATEFSCIEYIGGEQYVTALKSNSTSPCELRVSKGWLGDALNINAPVGTITSPETGTETTVVADRWLLSSTATYTTETNQGVNLFTTEYRSCGVKPLAVVPKVGYVNAIGGGQNNNGTDTGNTPGLFISQPGSSKSLSQRYGLSLGTNSASGIPDGALVEYELTPNIPINASIVTDAAGQFTAYSASQTLSSRLTAAEGTLTDLQVVKSKFESLTS